MPNIDLKKHAIESIGRLLHWYVSTNQSTSIQLHRQPGSRNPICIPNRMYAHVLRLCARLRIRQDTSANLSPTSALMQAKICFWQQRIGVLKLWKKKTAASRRI